DNLVALKALLPTYTGKIKCIYIDPPYNTGNEGWKYNDNVKSPVIEGWIGETVGKEGEDYTRHDKWLCMMMPRLKLLRELLSEDGIIFISIDDNEQHHLRQLLDEVFSQDNFVAQFTWKRRASSAMADNLVSVDHEYVICYRKSQEFKGFIGTPKDYKSYKNPDNDPRGDWVLGDLTVGMTNIQRPNQYYEITDPATGKIYQPSSKRVWAYIPSSLKSLIDDGRIYFPESTSQQPKVKRYLSELKSDVNPISTWVISKGEKTSEEETFHIASGLNSEGTRELQAIFGDKAFDYPKPVSLVKALIKQATYPDSFVLDSFAGSGTTAQAVLEANQEDGGSRKFILVEMEDYANTTTAERVRRVIKGVKTSKNEFVKKGLDGSFSYFELGDPIETKGLLSGKKLPSYLELARYTFYTATGEEFDETKINENRYLIGSSSKYEVYMIYKPELDFLKQTALTLNMARELRANAGNKHLLVFAPTKYVEPQELDELQIDFCQLPFEIYRVK
ncbi:MAG: site-specific DNA-methyltransferase, partial [Candidatus Saccharimonadales bacterium]